ncbi:MAG: tRNA (N6-isopentenyl adenosine(37)-C2)-methylthiotransferase MiaB [Clostridiales Family XIII bacterium]|jgi:tRNA-2-methylthio-N6-dimethylallyladenosine synthase|nr:tRNA (N6-isopentenyl adenosine(37)-C2)-methylthiotransferase MiaB [Clostridiales Family XIII bacterium]
MKKVNNIRQYYLIETMGCQMNERDSETVAGMLEELGYERAPAQAAQGCGGKAQALSAARLAADVIVVNTCSVRENADNKFFGTLGQIKKAKEADPCKIVAVCGCMMQQPHIVSDIQRRFPWVDIVFGTMNIEAFPSMLAGALNARKGRVADQVSPPWHSALVDIRTDAGEIAEGLPSRRARPFSAFVNITYGCNNFCTYCIVPLARGRERSRRPEAILCEVEALAADGVREITLLGQNVNSYRSPDSGGTGFPSLIRMLDAVPGIERIRFMTSHPKDLSDGLIDCYRTARRLCPSIHLPIQSGSADVLRRMNRGYSKEYYIALTEKLRAALPEIVITTDFIVGFPGETDADFEETMDVIERVRFDAAFTFLYSPREGTPAAEYEGRVPAVVAHARFDRMVSRLNAIAAEKNRAMLGRIYDVLIEGPSKTDESMLTGRTPGGKLVNIRPPARGSHELAGAIEPVRLVESGTFSFIGEFA